MKRFYDIIDAVIFYHRMIEKSLYKFTWKIIINGGRPLKGEVTISGVKIMVALIGDYFSRRNCDADRVFVAQLSI